MTKPKIPDTLQRRRWSHAEKARIVAESLTDGVLVTAQRRGIHTSTISQWRHHPDFRHLLEAERAELEPAFRAALDKALLRLMERLDDPKATANVAHVARALEVLHGSYQIITGGPTSRIESRNESLVGTFSIEEQAAKLSDPERMLLRDYARRVIAQKQATYMVKPAIPMLPEPEEPPDDRP
jgi:transposase-like protein